MIDTGDIRRRVLEFFAVHRRELPWRDGRNAYRTWVSEIMLQQTRVAAVIPYYQRWLRRFPTVEDLAGAELDDVLAAWSGLGYYSRARNLHRGAREVVERYGGELPSDPALLRQIPGIGRYTAGAIASQAHGVRAAVVDGNVARVLARLYGVELDIKSSRGQRELWALADELVPGDAPGDFNQGLMELGATVCTPRNPGCEGCPLADACVAHRQGRTAELPVTPRRKRAHEKDELRHQAVWLYRRGKVLLARRRPEGLYGGLWEIPQAPTLPDVGDAIGRDLELDTSEPLAVHQQELSHRVLHISLWRGRTSGRGRALPATSPYDASRWMTLTQAAKCGLSSVSQRLLDRAEKEPQWKTETAR